MQEKNDDIVSNSGFKAHNFQEEKKKADEIEVQHEEAANNTDKTDEQKILRKQKDTD